MAEVTDSDGSRRRVSGLVAGSYSRLAGVYDRVVTHGSIRFATRHGRDAIAAWARGCSGTPGAILDLPTGTGEYLADLPRPTVGVDLAPGMLVRAAERAGGASLVRADAYRLPFPDGAFGAVFTALGLQLFPRPRAAVVEMARVLAPGGALRGVVPVLALPPFVTMGTLRRALTVDGLEIEALERHRFLAFFTLRRTPTPVVR